MQIEVQKRARSACTTFKALKSEWDEVRGEAQDAMTVFANANLELRTVDDLSFPETLSEVDVREALRAKRNAAFEAADKRLDERRGTSRRYVETLKSSPTWKSISHRRSWITRMTARCFAR